MSITAAASAVPTPAAGLQTTGDSRSQRLHKAANQFEAMLLQEMLKPLAAKTEDVENAGEGDGQSGPLQGFGIQAVAESMARSGALGFASQIEHALAARGGAKPAAAK